MESLKASFERELKNKLSQKSGGFTSEETVLLKAFKYFDLNNNGTVEPDEFAKAIEKIGIMIPTKQDLQALFNIYDLDKSGGIDYKEFASGLFGTPVQGGSPAKGGAGGSGNPEDSVAKLRQKLASRGARGIIGLGKQFRIMDDNNNRSLDLYEFTKAMKDYMLGFSDGEIKNLFNYFDVDRSGSVDYDEFIRTLRGPMNPNRKRFVGQAYQKLDRDGNGYIDINDIKGVYNARNHPDVLQGKKTEEQILLEFLETFETHHSLRNNGAPDHIVTQEEFIEYYNNISASIDNDQYFELMMNSAWNLDGSRVTKAGWSNKDDSAAPKGGFGAAGARAGTAQSRKGNGAAGGYGAAAGAGARGGAGGRGAAAASNAEAGPQTYSEQQLFDVFRKKLAARGARGIIGLGKQFKIADDDNSKNLDVYEFKKCCHDFRIGISETDAEKLFGMFDRDHSGAIDYDEFLRGVRGEMNQFRKNLAKKAFNIMDKDKSGQLDLNDIRQSYNAKMHPDVKQGKKTEDEVLGEFLDTFEAQYSLSHPNSRDGSVSVDEWLEYYNNVSMSIDRDDYFELMMNNTWNLDGSRVTKKGWAGEY